MKSALKLPKLLYRTAILKLSHNNSNPVTDYDNAAASYDEYYSKYLGKRALEMLEKLPIKSGDCILDLACGTGVFSHPLAEQVGESGTIVAVDISPGMLQQNREKAMIKNLSNINFVESDALSFLQRVSSNSVDGVVCAWGICYMNHEQLRQELERVVKPGGFIGLIENRACTLKDVSDLFTKVIMDYPEAIVKNMVLHLPKDHKYLVKAFCKNSFKALEALDDFVIVPCKNGNEIVDYMVKSGASAGFINALEKSMVNTVFQRLIEYANEGMSGGKKILVKHEFSVLIGEKI